VDRRRLPDGCAAVFPRVARLRPGVVADLAGTGDGVEVPEHLAGLGVVGGYAAANAIVGARDAGVDAAVVVERRARDRVALLPQHDLRLPLDLAAPLVERDELAVELAEVDAAVAERDAAARPAAADGRDLRVEAGRSEEHTSELQSR